MEDGRGAVENLGLSPAFWEGKRVFITGHTGFKGSWLSEWLLSSGANVTGFALAPPTDPSLFEQLRLTERLNHIVGDVRDLPALRAAMGDSNPEIIFHMAAQSLVRQSYVEPLETYTTNVVGTANVLEVCRQLGSLRAVLVVTSDKCYENKEWAWGYRENEALGGYDPYSSSKACAELVVAAYRSSFFNSEAGALGLSDAKSRVAIATARAGNVIGGGDWAPDRLIPDAVRSFIQDEPIIVRNPDAVRPWQYVLDPLRGYLMLAERLAKAGNNFGEAWNFGPAHDDARSVKWVVDRLCQLWSEEASWKVSDRLEPYEARHLQLDCAKAHARLNWWPRLRLERALELTCEWYLAYSKGEDLGELTREQVRVYIKSDSNRRTS